MSPQDAMMHLKNMHNGANAGVSDPYKDGPFPKGKKRTFSICKQTGDPIFGGAGSIFGYF